VNFSCLVFQSFFKVLLRFLEVSFPVVGGMDILLGWSIEARLEQKAAKGQPWIPASVCLSASRRSFQSGTAEACLPHRDWLYRGKLEKRLFFSAVISIDAVFTICGYTTQTNTQPKLDAGRCAKTGRGTAAFVYSFMFHRLLYYFVGKDKALQTNYIPFQNLPRWQAR
jgi:hypothetical protein